MNQATWEQHCAHHNRTFQDKPLKSVLLALPYSDAMPCTLREMMFKQLKRMKCSNPGFRLELGLFDEPYR